MPFDRRSLGSAAAAVRDCISSNPGAAPQWRGEFDAGIKLVGEIKTTAEKMRDALASLLREKGVEGLPSGILQGAWLAATAPGGSGPAKQAFGGWCSLLQPNIDFYYRNFTGAGGGRGLGARQRSLLYGIRACFTKREPALREGSLSEIF